MVFTVSMSKIASPKSAAWALSILSERDVDLDALEKCRLMEALRAGECEQHIASRIIDQFRYAPRLGPAPKAAPVTNGPDVPAGRYALDA